MTFRDPPESFDWFDPHNEDHLAAVRHLENGGTWPVDFIQPGMGLPINWQILMYHKLAQAWMAHKAGKTSMKVLQDPKVALAAKVWQNMEAWAARSWKASWEAWLNLPSPSLSLKRPYADAEGKDPRSSKEVNTTSVRAFLAHITPLDPEAIPETLVLKVLDQIRQAL